MVSPGASRCDTILRGGSYPAATGPVGPVAEWFDGGTGQCDKGAAECVDTTDMGVHELERGPIAGFRNALLPALALWGLIAALAMVVGWVLG